MQLPIDQANFFQARRRSRLSGLRGSLHDFIGDLSGQVFHQDLLDTRDLRGNDRGFHHVYVVLPVGIALDMDAISGETYRTGHHERVRALFDLRQLKIAVQVSLGLMGNFAVAKEVDVKPSRAVRRAIESIGKQFDLPDYPFDPR